MGIPAIQVSGVTKIFQIFERPHDRLMQAVGARISRLLGKTPRKYCREFTALEGVSFDVKRGDTVGIIGQNGSGKSTLLQIICGTLSSTEGGVAVVGRVAALLELGAGFNPEFTGRENVYMSAAILGLSRDEVDARYDSIVAFADIGDFLEQPVKIYSSGMYVRLAFAVIAHVDADVLIVDEALAVGDAIFVQKCMRFLRTFREKGTLLFVSHDAASVTGFCQRVIWLDHGKVRMEGEAQKVMAAYAEYCASKMHGDKIEIASLEPQEQAAPETLLMDSPAPDISAHIFNNIAYSEGWQSGHASILSVDIEAPDGESRASFHGGEKVVVKITAEAKAHIVSPILGFFVKDRLGQSLFGEHTFTHVQPPIEASPGDLIQASFVFVLPLLPNGDYSMTVSIAEGDPYSHVQHHWLHDALLIKVSSPTLRYGLVGIPFESVVMSRTQGPPAVFESQIPPLLSDDPRVSIGRFTYGSPSLRVWAPEDGIHIGSFCSIADGVVIMGGGEHRSDWITTYPLRIALGHPLANADGHPATKGVTRIGHDVWIGQGAMILSGVSIGPGAIIAAGAVVSRSVAPYAVVAGNPARRVKSRFDDGQIAALLEIGWWDWPIDKIHASLPQLCSVNIDAFIEEYRSLTARHATAGTQETQ